MCLLLKVVIISSIAIAYASVKQYKARRIRAKYGRVQIRLIGVRG